MKKHFRRPLIPFLLFLLLIVGFVPRPSLYAQEDPPDLTEPVTEEVIPAEVTTPPPEPTDEIPSPPEVTDTVIPEVTPEIEQTALPELTPEATLEPSPSPETTPTTEPPKTPEGTAEATELPPLTSPPVFMLGVSALQAIAGFPLEISLSVSDDNGIVRVVEDVNGTHGGVSVNSSPPVETTPPFNTGVLVTYLAPSDYVGMDTFILTAIDAAGESASATILIEVLSPTPTVEVTQEATLEVTSEATLEVTPEVTAEATAEVTPQLEEDERVFKGGPGLMDLWAVVLQPGSDPHSVAEELGFEYVGPVGQLPETYVFRKAQTDTSMDRSESAATMLRFSDDVIWYEQQYASEVENYGQVDNIVQGEETPEPEDDLEAQAGFEPEVILEPEANVQPIDPNTVSIGPDDVGAAILAPSADYITLNGSGSLEQSFAFDVNGDVIAVGKGMRNRGSGEINITGIPPDATVRAALLYWVTIGYGNSYNTVQVNGTTVIGALIGTGGTTCWSEDFTDSNYAYRADVTSLVDGNGKYLISGLPNFAPPNDARFGSPLTDSQGATLVVIYQSPTQPRRRIIINDGVMTRTGGGYSMTNALSNFTTTDPITGAKLILLVGDGQRFTDGITSFNGRTIALNRWKGATGNYWDTNTFDVRRLSPFTTPTTVQIDTVTDCLVWTANILSVSTNWHPSDAYHYPWQWHLLNTGQFRGSRRGIDANVAWAWNLGYDGDGVQIAIVDDGLQHTHPDLAGNYVPIGSRDFVGNDPDDDDDYDDDPSPSPAQGHGTAAAGVAAAGINGVCGVGAAYHADLAGIRLTAVPQNDASHAAALSWMPDVNDIYSISWGPPDGGWLGWDDPTTPGLEPGWNRTRALEAIQQSVTIGRGGLGSIYVWAAGNGRAVGDNMNASLYANSRFGIAVGAVTNQGRVAWYSEPGAALFISAPGGRDPDDTDDTDDITTTDLLGGDGYNGIPGNLDCTNKFGRTSSAAPLVSGVIAMMLEANPDLGWRDVQHILALTATRVAGSGRNRAGYNISDDYGFGLVNASAAVELARHWINVPEEVTYTLPVTSVNQAIPDGKSITSTIDVTSPDPYFVLEHVEVIFNARHTRRGEIEVILTAPSGTSSKLMTKRQFDRSPNGYENWRFMTVRNWGESAVGRRSWQLVVRDSDKNGETGTFEDWQLVLHGYIRPWEPIGRPTLVTPANKAISTNPVVQYAWTAVTDATAYDIEFDTESRFQNPPYFYTLTDTSIPFELSNGKWYWRVRGRSLNQFGDWSKTGSITIDTVGPASPWIRSPAYQSVSRDRLPDIRWYSSEQGATYIVQIDNSNSFDSPEVNAAGIRRAYYHPEIPLDSGLWFVRVAAVDASGNVGPFSAPTWYFLLL